MVSHLAAPRPKINRPKINRPKINCCAINFGTVGPDALGSTGHRV
jgi:hypothetical protein